MEAYQNTALPPAQRARDLLSRMTLREKVGQVNQRLYGFRVYTRCGDTFELTQEFREEVERFGGLGVLYGLYRADPWADKDENSGITLKLSQKAYNMVQKYVMDHSRLGIPMLLGSECPHGHQALGGGLLPVNLAVGASFDPELLKRACEACGKQLFSGHVDLALMSVLDILRDPRWGRSEECYSEDPYLSSRMAEAAVSGMQSSGVSCVAKHFCAQGETTGGVNASAAGIGERELREIHFPAAAACCKAGVDGIMAAYNEIDGVYCHSNPWLLRKVLREEMGFEGVVMADGLAIDLLKNTEGDTLQAAAAALRAGVDISLWDEAYSRLEEAVEKGIVEESLLDEAALRVLELKFRRGLYEHPYMQENMISAEKAGVEDLSLQLARESVVLLKNQAISLPLLPLEHKFRKIGVIGSHAVNRYCQLGDYTPPVPKEDCVTVLQGLRRCAPEGVEVEYTAGCGFSEEMPGEMDKALRLAEKSDVLVVVLGGSSSRFDKADFDANGAAKKESGGAMDCGEGMDCASLHIPQVQEKLLSTLQKTGKPIVTVLIAGRPYCIGEITENSSALLYAFYPGPMGGQAIAEILYGRCAPSGRLPVSVPENAGQLPVYYNTKVSSQPAYCDIPGQPLFTFGGGLTYTEFCYEQVHTRVEDLTLKVTFQVRNTGQREGVAVPQLYIRRFGGGTVPRIKELKSFLRLHLMPGEAREAVLIVKKEDLKMAGISGSMEWIRGRIRMSLCDCGREYWNGELQV